MNNKRWGILSSLWKILGFALTAACLLWMYSPYILDRPGFSGDSIKFQYLGAAGGVPHPTGYPVYLAVNALVSRLPFGSLAGKINLLNLAYALAALGIFYAVQYRLHRSVLLSIFLTLFVGLTPAFELYACTAEVYSLHWLLLLALLALGLSEYERPTAAKFAGILALSTLALLHHLLIVTVLPGVSVLLILRRSQWPSRTFQAVAVIACLVVFLSVHAAYFLYIRSEPWYVDPSYAAAGGYLNYIRGGAFQGRFLAGVSVSSFFSGLGRFHSTLREEWSSPFHVAFCLSLAAFAWRGWSGKWRRETYFLSGFLLWFLICSQYDIADIRQYMPHGVLLGMLFIGSVAARLFESLPPVALRYRAAAVGAWGAGLLILAGPHHDPWECVEYRFSDTPMFHALLEALPENGVVLPGWYEYEQYFLYYAAENHVWNKEAALWYVGPESVRDYLREGRPLPVRGAHRLEPGRRVFALINLDAYKEAGLCVTPLPAPPDSLLQESFVERIQKIPGEKDILLVTNDTQRPALTPEALEGLARLGFELPSVPEDRRLAAVLFTRRAIIERKTVFAVDPKDAWLVDKMAGARAYDFILYSKRLEDGSIESLIEWNNVRLLPNRLGLSFVVVDSGTGRLRDAFSVDPALEYKVHPLRLHEITAPPSADLPATE